MTQEEWEKVDQSFEELCNVYLPIEYAHEFRQFTRTISRFIDDNKPFEVEVGKEYVATLSNICLELNGQTPVEIFPTDEVKVIKITKEVRIIIFEYIGIMHFTKIDQFKASFKPIEEE